MRDFNEWLGQFRHTIAGYDYYVDFKKVYGNIENYKIELNILNSLIGSKNIEADFDKIVLEYPKIMKCIPLLLAIRGFEIYVKDNNIEIKYDFKKLNQTPEQYKVFMRETGLFDLISNHIINNLVDYVIGVEVGLDSNARKNRGGHTMEDLVESFLKAENIEYYKEMKIGTIEEKWGLKLPTLSNDGKTVKKFDFVVRTNNCIYAIETNFYTGSGSKLNETARSYEMLARHARSVDGFKFIWFTDGIGWNDARNNLAETFAVLDSIYNIKDLENGIMKEIFK